MKLTRRSLLSFFALAPDARLAPVPVALSLEDFRSRYLAMAARSIADSLDARCAAMATQKIGQTLYIRRPPRFTGVIGGSDA
jgi:hypothetical protein